MWEHMWNPVILHDHTAHVTVCVCVGGLGNAPMYPMSQAHNVLLYTVTGTNGTVSMLALVGEQAIGHTRTHPLCGTSNTNVFQRLPDVSLVRYSKQTQNS